MKQWSVLLLVIFVATAFMQEEVDPLAIPDYGKDEVICFALYTVHNNVLKLTAQLYPLDESDPIAVYLDVEKNGEWQEIAGTEIVNPGWTAPFRIENWDVTKDVPYRVRHGESAEYTGMIKSDPVDKESIVVAVFTGNSVISGHGGDIPKNDIVENLLKIKPDLLFFSGDQVYHHTRHYEAWLKFGRDFGDIIRVTPTVCLPDDHDVGQGNIWGAGGKKSATAAGDDGGFFSPVEYVNEVYRAQTSHLPDPYDSTPIDRGILVCYTSLNIGGIDFAIIEDRKWKTGPNGLIPQMGPRPDHVYDPEYDPKSVDVSEAVLLGERQLNFLRDWATNWQGAEMKAVLSQTVFANAAHIHGKIGGRLHADLDSNGWPQSGRNRALAEMRKAFAIHLCGDQHLATVIHHGIDEWNDANWSFCVPSIANYYLRWWQPLDKGKNREPWMPEYLGEFVDGFNNKLTMYAVNNPDFKPNDGNKLTTRAAGFGLVKFNKATREITLECWPRNVDITDPDARQYNGWPITVGQEDNYGRKPIAYLPTLQIEGTDDPVVQIIDESNDEIVYTLRINGATFRPKVFRDGSYTIKIGEGVNIRTLNNLKSIGLDGDEVIKVSL